MIKLKQADGLEITINAEYVEYVQATDHATVRIGMTSGFAVHVTQKLEFVLQQITSELNNIRKS